MAAALGSLLTGLLVVFAGQPVLVTVFAIAGLALLACACVLAGYRFDVFIVLLLTIRPSLDRIPLDAGPFDVSSILALVFLVAGALWLTTRARQAPLALTPLSIALLTFAGIAGLSSLVSASPVDSAIAASKTLSGVMMFFVLESLLRERPDRLRSIVTAVLASAVVPCLFALEQFATGAGSSTASGSDLGRVTGTFFHPNPFATFLAIVLVLAVAVLPHVHRLRDRLMIVAVGALVTVCLLLTFARGGWIAAVVGLAYLLGKRSFGLLVLAGAVLVATVMLVPPVQERFADLAAPPPVEGVPANSLQWRLHYWEDVLPLAATNPLTGIGLEGVQDTTPSELPPHNAYVQSYVETGVLGLGALLAIIVTGFISFRRRVRDSRPGLERGLAIGATAVALGLLAQTLTENLLTQTMAIWYFAAAATWGLGRRSPDERLELGFTSHRPVGPQESAEPLEWAPPSRSR